MQILWPSLNIWTLIRLISTNTFAATFERTFIPHRLYASIEWDLQNEVTWRFNEFFPCISHKNCTSVKSLGFTTGFKFSKNEYLLFQQLLNEHPFHIDSMLQLSEICKMGEDSTRAAELVERTLYALEAAFHPLFNLAVGTSRLDYKRQEIIFS